MPRHYLLVDGDAMAKAHPDTFIMPPLKRRKSLQVGDNVKLGFRPAGGPRAVADERLWVTIEKVDAYSGFKGRINNDPVVVKARRGEAVTFERKHILCIDEPEAEVTA